MITIKYQSIFESQNQILVCPVNCVGIMGKGLALSFKNKYPWYYQDYRQKCMDNTIQLNKITWHENPQTTFDAEYIISFPTKNHWKDISDLYNIQLGIDHLKSELTEKQYDSISIPAIGCGLGGLNWNIVKNILVNQLNDLKNIKITIHEPY